MSDGEVVHKKDYIEPQAIDAVLEQEKPNPWGPGMKKMYLFSFLCFWGSAMNGFDGSLFGSIYYQPQFTNFWGFSSTSDQMVLLTNMYTFGGLVSGFCVSGPASDTWGRRAGLAIGSVIVVIGTIMCATITSPSMAVFGTGRFLCGFGVQIVASAAPAWVIEMAHPAYRGLIGGIYNTFWFVGNIFVTWVVYATINQHDSDAAWRLPYYIQLIPAILVLIGAAIMPESARWLIGNGKTEQARKILVDLHADGNENSQVVALEIQEMTAGINTDGSDKRFWDYRGLFSTPGARYRMFMVFFISFFGQMSGSNMFSYYNATVLEAAGWSDDKKKQLFNALQSVVQFLAALFGAWVVNKLGRRSLIIPGTALFAVWLALLSTATKLSGAHREGEEATAPFNSDWANVAVAAPFLFQVTNAIAWTPMQALYPVECLDTTTRAKGMGLSGVIVQAALAFNQYVIPKGIDALGWKFYIIYIAWDLIEAILMYFFLVETKGFTLEELEEIFEAPNPRKASLQAKPSVSNIDV
ncbi:hypothetical protein HDV00_001438 [Rhizophlyctis rosea]|nr:hypothetical protein HDV00_001438 [Rhizophlyctis rosea]